MFSSLFESFEKVSNNQNKKKHNGDKTKKTIQQNVDNMLMILNEIKDESYNNSVENIVTANSKVPLTNEYHLEDLSNGHDLDYSFEDNRYYNSSIRASLSTEDPSKNDIFYQIKSLQCLFTWKLKSPREQDFVTHIKKKYGSNNLDISIPEFTFVRFIGNLIISYELYKNGESDASDLKILEIGNWLEKLDKGTDQFYRSISVALKHIRMANFIHKLFAENETGGFKMLLNEIVTFENMDNKSKAAVHAIHSAILIEYGVNPDCYKNASEYAKKAIELDSETSHWFHIHALVLTTQRELLYLNELYTSKRQFSKTNELYPIDNEINLAIQQAIIFSNFGSTCSLNSLILTALNQFVTSEFQMILNGLSGFKTINSKYMSEENEESCLKEDINIIVGKHKNGADAVPFLTLLVPKYNQQNKWKVIAQICSYTLLFTNYLRFGVELFLMLIEDPDVPINDLIINHRSSFINKSKIFNLAELIWNEIRITTKYSVSISSGDILFYYKMFFKIEEIFNLKMKVVDPFMRLKLVGDLSARSNLYSNIMYKYEMYSPCNESFVDKGINILSKYKAKRHVLMQAELEQYDKPYNELANFQPFYNLNNFTSQNTNTCFNQNCTDYDLFEQYQSSKSMPSSSNLNFNVTIQSTMYTKNITTTNITSNLINIDTSLSKLPRGSTSQATYNDCLKKLLKNYPDSFRIYTDASKIHNNVGIAIVSDKDSYTYKLSSEYTSCDAEAVAILRALDYALVENFNHYLILTDSLTTLTCIQNENISSDVIYSILCLIHVHRLKGNLMHLIWVPSHNAINGNEKADRLAKQIAISTTAITYSHNSFMTTNLKSKFFQT